MKALHLDYESRSTVDLPKTGVYVYAADPTTDIWCAAFAADDGEPKLWTPDQKMPAELEDGLLDERVEIHAHNAQFEWSLASLLVRPRYGWPRLPIERMRCTMAQAYAMSLPGALDNAGAALGLSIQKDPAGHRLMMQMARPRKIEDGKITWWDDADRRRRLYDYCLQDVRAEQALGKRLRPLSAKEQKVWELDQRINARGIQVDAPLCRKALQVVYATTAELDEEMRQATKRGVSSCMAVQQLLNWMKKQGVECESVNKESVVDLLAEVELPEDVRKALTLRQEAAKTSTAKIDTLLEGMSHDGRARGLLQYHAASTGRWGGRRFQPQNLPRPKIEKADIAQALKLIDKGDRETIAMVYGAPLSVVADCIRSLIAAGDGRDLLAADFSNIEGRVIAWWAGEQWKLDAFRQFDAGTGPDLYKVAGAGVFGVAPDAVQDWQRQIGKVCFTGDTLVVSSRGLIQIRDVTVEDKLWDGENWATHRGVICNGLKETQTVAGISATPDHPVLCGSQWKPWSSLADTSENTLSRSLATGAESWSSLATSFDPAAACSAFSSNATVERPSTASKTAISNVSSRPNARRARVPENADKSGIGSTLKPCPTTSIDAGCSIDWHRLSADATTRARSSSPVTVAEALRFTTNGGPIARHSCDTSKPSPDGTTPRSTWTESKTIGATNPETSGSSREGKTLSTDAKSGKWKSRSLVYDVLSCGPNNRFTILSEKGPLVVHNCELALGYQGGVGAFAAMAATYGLKIESQYDIILNAAAPHLVDRAAETFAKAKRRPAKETYMPSEVVKLAWREQHPAIVRLWYRCEEAVVSAVEQPGKVFAVNGVRWRVNGSFLWCALPSGRLLCYPYPKIGLKETPWGEMKPVVQYKGVDSRTRKWGDQHTYAGKLAENVTQAIARDFMVDAMLRVEQAGYPIVMTVHDEILCEPRTDFGSLDEFCDLMKVVPSWGAGCPISVAGWRGERYRK